MTLQIRWLDSGLVEEAFLSNLFEDATIESTLHNTYVVVYSGIQREPSPELQGWLAEKVTGPMVLFHLSDEKLRHRNAIYSEFDLVVRNYFDPRLSWKKNVVFFPLGWTKDFAGAPFEFTGSRTHLWSFCGATKASRTQMLQEFSAVNDGFVHLSSGWNAEDQLPPSEVKKVYSDSVFVLCPFGNAHFDTFRIMEALQAGAIPVITKFLRRDFARYTFGDHPFLVAENWAEAADKLRELADDSTRLQEYQAKVQAWYQNYLHSLQEKIRQILLTPGSPEARKHLVPHSRDARFDVALMISVARAFAKYRR
jgi:hypothetical protein